LQFCGQKVYAKGEKLSIIRQGMQIYISYIYCCPKKKGCLGQQLASINHAKVLKGRATVHEWWYDLKKPTQNQYLTWIYLFMGCPTWWTLPVRKMSFQLICWPGLDRNFWSAINNRLNRGRIFLPKVQKNWPDLKIVHENWV